MARESINWPVVTCVTIAGFAMLGVGIWLGDGAASAWSSAFIEVGVAIGLLSVLVLLEHRVVRRVAESTARVEAERVTADLRERIEHLEDVDAVQRERRAEQRRLADARGGAIRNGQITSSAIGDLLVEAVHDHLIDPDHFHVRAGSDPSSPVLYMLPLIDPKRVVAVFLDFEPFQMADEPFVVEGTPIPVPSRTASTVMWSEEDAASVGAELQAGLERRNEPTHGFGFGHAIEMLLRSLEVMRQARVAPAGSPDRLQGELRVLINADWAYTSHGLEALTSDSSFPVKAAGWADGGHRWVGPYMYLSDELRSSGDASLGEALVWLQQREGIRILEPGTDPVRSLFRQRNRASADQRELPR